METAGRTRTKNLVIRLSDEERAELDAVAAHERVSASDIIRMSVRRLYVERFGTKKAIGSSERVSTGK